MPIRNESHPILTAMAFTLLLGMGCQPVAPRPVAGGGSSAAGLNPTEDTLADLDLGEDWDHYERQLSSRNALGSAPAAAPTLRGGDAVGGPGFAIVLATFGGDAHREQANQFRDRAAILLPDMAGSMRLHPSAGGSLVVCGEYSGWKDPNAKQDIRTLQEMTINGVQVFPQAMLTELLSQRDPNSIDDAELVSLRLRYPDIRVLYTLEIAIWGDFESGQWPEGTRRNAAERYARSLRLRGVPAFYHHDPAREMSMVTVGVFDHRAIDGQTGLRSPQVERFLMDFPERMVNGEQIIDLYDPSDPSKGGRPQEPRIVEVPTL